MEKVLNFAVCELTKIVEASFDDLLLEITKMETEHQILEEKLDKKSHGGGGGGGGGGVAGKRRGSENDSVSPSGSEDAREDLAEVAVMKEKTEAGGGSKANQKANLWLLLDHLRYNLMKASLCAFKNSSKLA